MVVLAAWLSTKINSPLVAGALGFFLICLAIYGMVKTDMSPLMGTLIIIVGVINMLRLLPSHAESTKGSTP